MSLTNTHRLGVMLASLLPFVSELPQSSSFPSFWSARKAFLTKANRAFRLCGVCACRSLRVFALGPLGVGSACPGSRVRLIGRWVAYDLAHCLLLPSLSSRDSLASNSPAALRCSRYPNTRKLLHRRSQDSLFELATDIIGQQCCERCVQVYCCCNKLCRGSDASDGLQGHIGKKCDIPHGSC